jgi:hypothetical protein
LPCGDSTLTSEGVAVDGLGRSNSILLSSFDIDCARTFEEKPNIIKARIKSGETKKFFMVDEFP